MCSPLAIAGFAFSAISTIMQQRAAASEARMVSRQNQASFALAQEQADSRLQSEREALANRRQQTIQAGAEEGTEIAQEAARLKASVRVSQGQSALTGSTLALLSDVTSQAGIQFTRLDQAIANELRQISLESSVVLQNRNNEVSSAALGGNQRIETASARVPSALSSLVKIGASAVDIFGEDFSGNLAESRRTPSGNAASTGATFNRNDRLPTFRTSNLSFGR